MKYAFISSNIEQFKVILKVCCFVVLRIGTMLRMGRKRLNRLAKFLWPAASNSGNCH